MFYTIALNIIFIGVILFEIKESEVGPEIRHLVVITSNYACLCVLFEGFQMDTFSAKKTHWSRPPVETAGPYDKQIK